MAELQKKYNCSLELTMDLIGGKWKLIILWKLLGEPKRFSELNRLIPGITQKMLTTQLRELEEKGLVLRVVYPEVPPKVTYELSEQGKTLEEILYNIFNWANNYAQNNNIELDYHNLKK